MRNIFKRNLIWSIGMYQMDQKFSFSQKLNAPFKLFDSKTIRNSRRHIHTYADPFLYVYQNELYLFYESTFINEKGKIEAFKTNDLINFEYLGTILEEPFHVSYPCIFSFKSSIYMIPETVKGDEVILYQFTRFPYGLVKKRVLLKGQYADTSILKHDGIYYLFTTSSKGLEIFYTDDIEYGDLTPHPCNTITSDMRYCRNAGSFVEINNSTYRITQDCSVEYGKNIHIFKVKSITPAEYREELYIENFFTNSETWNRKGGHHLSITDFLGKKIIAVDGKQYDYFLNKFTALFYIINK